MTIARHQPSDYAASLMDGLRFTKAFAAGLLLTWVTSVVLTTTSVRADDQITVQDSPQQTKPHAKPMLGSGYVTNKSAGPGSGLIEPSLGDVLRRAAPITANESARAVDPPRGINEGFSHTVAAALAERSIIHN